MLLAMGTTEKRTFPHKPLNIQYNEKGGAKKLKNGSQFALVLLSCKIPWKMPRIKENGL